MLKFPGGRLLCFEYILSLSCSGTVSLGHLNTSYLRAASVFDFALLLLMKGSGTVKLHVCLEISAQKREKITPKVTVVLPCRTITRFDFNLANLLQNDSFLIFWPH